MSGGTVSGVHSSRNSASLVSAPASSRASTDNARIANDSTDATGAPITSATAIDTAPSTPRANRTRTEEAPDARND
ncbi:hypothetical protein ABZ665_36695, partial [Streptomyces sp. NPDC007049]|uniref:hypothetical protein n=1 Tax=Streptomyces sp. NPDC007049 TaxID=3156912 RepID=UPI00340342AC